VSGVLAAFTVFALLASATLQARTRLEGWNRNYPLLIGNEATGDRPWRGEVLAAEITDAATPVDAMRAFAAGDAITLPGSPIGVFDFRTGPPYRDASRTLPDLVRLVRRQAIGEETPGDVAWLRSKGPAFAIADRVARSNAFTVRVVCVSDDIEQAGPARIITNSRSTGVRNFTLGQQGRNLVVRLRTPQTGANGGRPEIVVPDVFTTGQLHDLLVTYDGASLLATVAGSERVHRTSFNPGSSLALVLTSLQVEADELPYLDAIYVAALLLVPGGLIGSLGWPVARRFALGVAWALVFVVMLEGSLVLASGQSFAWPDVAANAAIAAVVLPIAALGSARAQKAPEAARA